MKPFPLIRHLLAKDFRHQRLWILLVWILAISLPFIARHDAASDIHGSTPLMTLSTGALLLLLAFVLVRLIRLDAPGRDFHFLATRPVPWRPLLVSKIIFTALFLVVPVLVARWGAIPLLDIPVTGMDIFLYLVETAIYLGAALAVVLVFSLFLRHLAVIFAAILGTAILITLGNAWLHERDLHNGASLRLIDSSLQSSCFLVFCLALSITIGLVTWLRYRSKSLLPPLSLLVVGLTCSLLLKSFWPWHLGEWFPDSPKDASMPAALRNQNALDFSPKENQEDRGLNGSSWDGTNVMGLNRYVVLKGLQAPYFATIVTYQAEATLKSGLVIHSAYEDVSGHGGVGGMGEEHRFQLLGFSSRENPRWDLQCYELFNYLPNRYPKDDLTGVRIKGVVTLEIRRAVLVKTMPFREGATVDWCRTHYVLRKAAVTATNVPYDIASQTISLALHGESDGWSFWKQLKWVIYNRSQGDFLGGGSEGEAPGAGRVLSVARSYQGAFQKSARYGNWKKAQQPFPDDWMSGAEIAFIGSEPCGTIRLPYEIPSLDLRH